MKTPELIEKLISDLLPVRPQQSPFVWSIIFGLVSLGIVLIAVLFKGIRTDLPTGFVFKLNFDLAATFATYFLTLFYAAVLSNPGRESESGLERLVLLALVGVFVVDFGWALRSPFEQIYEGLNAVAFWECSRFGILFSTLGAVPLVAGLRARLILQPFKASFAVAIASWAAGRIGTELFCTYENAMHVGLWHAALPFLVMMFLLGASTRIFWRVNR